MRYISDMDGYERVFRVVCAYNAFDSSYGIVYTKNSSRFPLKETQTFDLWGMDIIWPPGVKSGQPHEMELGPEEDEIVILRRTDESCQYSLSYVTRPRELEDDELIEKAK